MDEKECPECGSHDVRAFSPTPYGYWCGGCKASWDEYPEEQN